MFREILSAAKKATDLVVDVFVPGIGNVPTPIDQVNSTGYISQTVTGYKSIKEIRALAYERNLTGSERRAKRAGQYTERKPEFILSKSKTFRKRVGRIIYGKEGEGLFL